MTVLLVDDDELELKRLLDACKANMPSDEFLAFTDPNKALKETKDVPLNLAFLDIRMPSLDGIALAGKLKFRDPATRVIFATAHDEYALEAFRVHASGYLTKPITAKMIKAEMEELNRPLSFKPAKKIQAKCFGNFEIFHDGKPIKFKRSKSKEIMAYLIDREGAAINVNELNAILWEEDNPSYLRNLISDIQQSLREIGCEDVFIKRHNECFIDVTKIDCDAYEYANGNPEAIRAFRGQYMFQYDWAMFVDD